MSTSTTIVPGQRPSSATYTINYVYDSAFTWYTENTVPENISVQFVPTNPYKPFGARVSDVELLEVGQAAVNVSYTVLQLVNGTPEVITISTPAVESVAFNCFSAAQFAAVENTPATNDVGYQNPEPFGVPVALLATESIIPGPLPNTWEIGNTANGYSSGSGTQGDPDAGTLNRILTGVNVLLTVFGKPTV